MPVENPDSARLSFLSDAVDQLFQSLLAGVEQAALLDFPNHPNVGDSAIYCGEMAAMRRSWNGRLSYISSFSSYDRTTLTKSVGDGLLMIHGGGNVGEIYPHHHAFRLRMLREWRGRRLVQLPQTLHFSSREADDEFARAIEYHGNFHFILRDQRSFDHARARYQCETTLAPDSAFALGDLSSQVASRHSVLALCRTDAERRDAVDGVWPNAHVAIRDWPTEPSLDEWTLPRLVGRLGTFTSRHGLARGVALANWSFNHRASVRLQRGLDLLSSGRVVATDRLHAYILALKLNKQYFVADNSYGKLSAIYQTWLTGTVTGTWCNTLHDAITMAVGAANSDRHA